MSQLEVKSFRVAGESPSPGGFEKVATLDVAFGPDLTVHNFRLVRTPSGTLQLYAPDRSDGHASASLSPALRAQISALAALILESSLDRNSADAT